MKRILIISLAFLAFACGKDHKSVDAILNSGDLSAIKAKRYELAQQQRDIRAELDKLDAYIDSHENTDRPVLVTAEVVGDTIFNHFVEVQGNVDTDQNVVLNGEFSGVDRKSTRLNSSHVKISYAVFCLKKKKRCNV